MQRLCFLLSSVYSITFIRHHSQKNESSGPLSIFGELFVAFLLHVAIQSADLKILLWIDLDFAIGVVDMYQKESK